MPPGSEVRARITRVANAAIAVGAVLQSSGNGQLRVRTGTNAAVAVLLEAVASASGTSVEDRVVEVL